MSDWKSITEGISGTIELTEDSSQELLRMLEELDAEFINELLEGKRDFTIRGSDGRSVELTPKALEKKEVSEDAISREYLEEQYWQTLIPKEMINTDIELGINIGITKMYEILNNAPKPKKGEWILECDAEGEGDNLYRCPRCGQRCGCQEYDLPNFCPNCGAEMKG